MVGQRDILWIAILGFITSLEEKSTYLWTSPKSGQLGLGKLGSGKLGPRQLGHGAQLSRAQVSGAQFAKNPGGGSPGNMLRFETVHRSEQNYPQ